MKNKQKLKDLLQLGSCVLYLNSCIYIRWYARWFAFVTKTGLLFCFRTDDFESLWLWGSIIFTSETMKRRTCWCTKGILRQYWIPWTLLLGLCYIICAQKSRPAKWNYRFPPLIYSIETSFGLVEEERVHITQSNYSFLIIQNVVHISWRHVCKIFKCH